MAKSTVNKISLKVIESEHKDVGKGKVRLDPADMKILKVETGDVVEIKGKRKTAAKIWPTKPENRGKKIIQLDPIVRQNAKTSLDEMVEIKKIHHKTADKVVLNTAGSVVKSSNIRYIGQELESLVLVAGDKIRVDFLGLKPQDFTVSKTEPDGVVIIQSGTQIKLKGTGTAPKKGETYYEDIGGLDDEIQRIREMIELPLKYPEIFERLGIDPPKGVLLHGPPGCGKTRIARAVAKESNVKFFSISGPEIMHKFIGESEEHLRALFKTAEQSAPAIIFIDEIDSIAPKRESLSDADTVAKRVVSQLLALMDGLKDRGKIVVIAATNIPNVLDPALRRPGRFDREICISIPNQEGRLEILEIHSRAMPLADNVNLKELSEITHGFTGADIESLCREAAMTSIMQIVPDINFALGKIPYERLTTLEIRQDDFLRALNFVEASALREVAIETPNVCWEDVGGLEDVKQTLKDTIEHPLKYPFVFEHAHSKPPNGILFYGLPGTGKTLLAKATAKESGVNFISIKGPSLITKWVGESEKGIREIFKKAKQNAPCIIFFDEIDSIAPSRGNEDPSGVTQRVVSQLLTEMSGIEELKGVLVIGATNRLDIIDKALLRPGRFDFILEIPLPDEKVRLDIFKIHTKKTPLSKDVDLEKLAKMTEEKTGADIESICQKAIILAIRTYISKNKEPAKARKNLAKFTIGMKYFEKVVDEISKLEKEIAV